MESEEDSMHNHGRKSDGGDRDVYEVCIGVGKHYLGVYIGGEHASVSPHDSIALVAPKQGMNRGQANKEAKQGA